MVRSSSLIPPPWRRGGHGPRRPPALGQHVLLHPLEEDRLVAGDLVPADVEGVVALVVALRVGGVGAARHHGDGRDGPGGEDHRIGVARAEFVDDLLDGHHRALGGEHRLLLNADNALEHDVALAVGLQRVDDGDVRAHGRDGGQHLARIGAGDRADVRIDLRQVDALVAAEDREGQVRRARLEGIGHGGVGMFLDGEAPGLDLLAHPVQRADAGIAGPGEDELLRLPHADDLVIDDVGRHADQRQVLLALADHLMTGGIGDEMGEPLHRHAVAVAQVGGDGVVQGHERGHAVRLLVVSSVARLLAPGRATVKCDMRTIVR